VYALELRTAARSSGVEVLKSALLNKLKKINVMYFIENF
jgi:hypothetical protein